MPNITEHELNSENRKSFVVKSLSTKIRTLIFFTKTDACIIEHAAKPSFSLFGSDQSLLLYVHCQCLAHLLCIWTLFWAFWPIYIGDRFQTGLVAMLNCPLKRVLGFPSV